jgi:hypothetical protein
MQIRLKRWSVFALLLCVAMGAAAIGSDFAQLPSDQTRWNHLVSNAMSLPEENLINYRLQDSTSTVSERFYVASAECSANAVALLAVDDLLPDEAKSIRVGTKTAWGNKTAIFLRRSYADGRNFLFLCLVSESGKLERTRLLRPELRDKKFAVEIDSANYEYGGN